MSIATLFFFYQTNTLQQCSKSYMTSKFILQGSLTKYSKLAFIHLNVVSDPPSWRVIQHIDKEIRMILHSRSKSFYHSEKSEKEFQGLFTLQNTCISRRNEVIWSFPHLLITMQPKITREWIFSTQTKRSFNHRKLYLCHFWQPFLFVWVLKVGQ